MSTGGGAISATNALNDFTGNLSVSTTGNASIADANDLSFGTVSTGTFLARALGGNMTLTNQAQVTGTSGDPLILTASGNFINSFNSTALQTGAGGSWLTYSTNPANDTIGGLSNNFRRFYSTYGGPCPGMPASGNGFLYSYTPNLTVTPSGISVTYGAAAPSLSGYSHSISGYLGSDSGCDTVTVTTTLTGTTTYTAGSSVGSYNINYSSGALSSAMGYGFTYANNPTAITVNPAALTITANSQSIIYGTVVPVTPAPYSGFQNGEDHNALTAQPVLASARSGVQSAATYAGNYTASGAADTNYTISYVTGDLTVNPPALITTNILSDEVLLVLQNVQPYIAINTISAIVADNIISPMSGQSQDSGQSGNNISVQDISVDDQLNLGLYGIRKKQKALWSSEYPLSSGIPHIDPAPVDAFHLQYLRSE